MKRLSTSARLAVLSCAIACLHADWCHASLVPAGATWRYFDRGSDPGPTWRQPGFDDSTWSVGPGELGFGDGGEATVIERNIITAYFRRTFQVADWAVLTDLTLRVLRDDGVIVYLNGVEVVRDNMPPGDPTYFTLASAVAANETAYVEHQIAAAALVNGENVLAAEVHQVEVSSSDLSFDLELLAEGGPPPVELPVVELEVELSVATEPSLNIDPPVSVGLVRVFRTAPTEAALDVALSYSGSAENGVDVLPLPEIIRIPAGSAAVDLTVEAVMDAAQEGIETLVISLVTPPCAQEPEPGPGCYRVGPSRDAAVRILDADDPPPPPPPHVLVPAQSVWKYLDDGSDQGTAWRAPDFDDSAWLAGRGQLGYGDGDEATLLRFGPDPTEKHITYYFRHAFDVGDPSPVTSLGLRVLRDDGVIVYLNGVEVFRNNLPPENVGFQTLASVAPDENTYLATMIPPDLLIEGRNVLAAEVHQSSPVSSDVGFDLELLAGDGEPTPDLPAVTIRAIDAEAAEQDPDLDQVPNTGLFLIARTGPTDQPLQVSVRYEDTAQNGVDYLALPESIEIPAGAPSVELLVEAIDDDLAEGTETARILLEQPACANQFPPPPGCYRIGVSSAATVVILDNDEEEPGETSLLVGAGSVWRFLDDGTDQGSGWRASEFDDSSWAAGPGPLGYGDGDEATLIDFGGNPADKHTTYYFRHGFEVTDLSRITGLVLQVLRDDGVVLYLNGTEIYRENLPAGAVTYDTFAVMAAPEENAYHPAVLSADALVAGRNVLAAEIHQVDPASSDAGFDLELSAELGPEPLEIQLLPEGSDGGIQFMVLNPEPASYVVEFSTDLSLWTPVQSIDSAENGEALNCPRPADAPAGFYRLRRISH